MFSFPSTNSKFTVTIQGDYDGVNNVGLLYSRSRSMMRLHREDAQKLTIFSVKIYATPNTWTLYYSDPQGTLEIPLKNHVAENMAAGTLSLTVHMYEVNDIVNVVDSAGGTFNLFNGISYNDATAPRKKDTELWNAAYGHDVILPPNIILNPTTAAGLTGKGVIVESNFGTWGASKLLNLSWAQYVSGVGTAITPTGARDNQLEVGPTADTLKVTDGVDAKEWRLDKADYCTNLVCIRWTSLTGAVRQHYFPIVSFINGVSEAVSLISAGNGYDVTKNAFKGVRCRLTGLTPYSVCYYSDLIQAIDAHAVVYPTYSTWATEIASMETAAFVDANSVETPEGNGFYNFEFTLKLRHYDTV